jgi:hypothetical protein
MNTGKDKSEEEKDWDYLTKTGWTHLTDWTFTSMFPLSSLLKEGNELQSYYSKGKSRLGHFNKFMVLFGEKKGHTDLFGKLEEDYQI